MDTPTIIIVIICFFILIVCGFLLPSGRSRALTPTPAIWDGGEDREARARRRGSGARVRVRVRVRIRGRGRGGVGMEAGSVEGSRVCRGMGWGGVIQGPEGWVLGWRDEIHWVLW